MTNHSNIHKTIVCIFVLDQLVQFCKINDSCFGVVISKADGIIICYADKITASALTFLFLADLFVIIMAKVT